MDLRRLRIERIEVRVEVAPNPIHVDERVHLELLFDLLEAAALALGGIVILRPPCRLVGDAE